MHDHRESRPLAPEPELSLTELGVGTEKTASGPFAPAGRFERMAIVAAMAFQLLILVGMILGKTVPYLGAETVLLRVEPVDPRDLFRGDYVTLGYDISRIPGGRFQAGEPVFVTLVAEADGRHYRAGEFRDGPPDSGLYIRGTAGYQGRANYGIESYYVQEGTGHDYENAVRNRNLSAMIALDRNGYARLQRLVVE